MGLSVGLGPPHSLLGGLVRKCYRRSGKGDSLVSQKERVSLGVSIAVWTKICLLRIFCLTAEILVVAQQTDG